MAPAHRTLLHAAGIAVPSVFVASRVFALSRPGVSLDPLAAPPICHASAEVPLTVYRDSAGMPA